MVHCMIDLIFLKQQHDCISQLDAKRSLRKTWTQSNKMNVVNCRSLLALFTFCVLLVIVDGQATIDVAEIGAEVAKSADRIAKLEIYLAASVDKISKLEDTVTQLKDQLMAVAVDTIADLKGQLAATCTINPDPSKFSALAVYSNLCD